MNKEEFYQKLNDINIILNDIQKKQFQDYYIFLKDYNKLTNLTRIIEEEEVYLKHFYDSAFLLKYIDISQYSSLADVGTGAGFPAIVLKIIIPQLRVTLIESNKKKCEFLKLLIKTLNLTNIIVINDRAEIHAKQNREKYDLVVSRAMANMKILVELCIPMVKISGLFIAMKGSFKLTKEELKDAKNMINILNSQILKINEFKLNDMERTIVLVSKKHNTPLMYPREYKQIIKNKK